MADQISGLLSPFLRRRRFAAALPHLRGRVLDVGCGIGELAEFVPPESYLGIDLDQVSVETARQRHPRHVFQTLAEFETDPPTNRFDTIVGLAVIEHVPSPAGWLRDLTQHLGPDGRFVLTTPHPYYRWAHEFGARLGIFSRDAADEHEDFLDRRSMTQAATDNHLRVLKARRFLMGANQLFILGNGA
jgi:2-polyprenyl-3-methyl-5-hydroxy-6-metoxy-1,4-benzoquinol methylase